MKKVLIGLLLVIAPSLAKSQFRAEVEPNYGFTIISKGMNHQGVELRNEAGNMLSNHGIALDQKVKLIIQKPRGFVEKDHVSSIGASLMLMTESGRELLNADDLYESMTGKWPSQTMINNLSSSITAVAPMKVGDKMFFTFRLYDKNSDREIRIEGWLVINETMDIKTSIEKNSSYSAKPFFKSETIGFSISGTSVSATQVIKQGSRVEFTIPRLSAIAKSEVICTQKLMGDNGQTVFEGTQNHGLKGGIAKVAFEPSSTMKPGIYSYSLLITGDDSKHRGVVNFPFVYAGSLADGSPALLAIQKQASETYIALGRYWDEIRKGRVASQYFQLAIDLSPDDHAPYFEMGMFHRRQNQYDRALGYLQTASTKDPNHYFTNYHIGWIYNDKNDHIQAINYLDKAVAHNTSNYHQAYYERGLAKKKTKDLVGAAADFKKAGEIKPDYYNAFYQLGYCLVDLERYDEAIVAFGKAVDIRPSYYQPYYERGYAYKSKGDFALAIADFEKVVSLNLGSKAPKNLFAHLGDSYRVSGQKEKACETYQKGIAAGCLKCQGYKDQYCR